MSNYLLFLMMLWFVQAIALLVSPGLSHVTVFTKPLQTNCIFQEFYNIFFFFWFSLYMLHVQLIFMTSGTIISIYGGNTKFHF